MAATLSKLSVSYEMLLVAQRIEYTTVELDSNMQTSRQLSNMGDTASLVNISRGVSHTYVAPLSVAAAVPATLIARTTARQPATTTPAVAATAMTTSVVLLTPKCTAVGVDVIALMVMVMMEVMVEVVVSVMVVVVVAAAAAAAAAAVVVVDVVVLSDSQYQAVMLIPQMHDIPGPLALSGGQNVPSEHRLLLHG